MNENWRSTAKFYNGVMTARFGVPPTGQQQGDPDNIRYSALAVNTPDSVVLTNFLPTRRISKGAQVIAAEVGDPCFIHVINGVRYLFPITEGIPFQEACP